MNQSLTKLALSTLQSLCTHQSPAIALRAASSILAENHRRFLRRARRNALATKANALSPIAKALATKANALSPIADAPTTKAQTQSTTPLTAPTTRQPPRRPASDLAAAVAASATHAAQQNRQPSQLPTTSATTTHAAPTPHAKPDATANSTNSAPSSTESASESTPTPTPAPDSDSTDHTAHTDADRTILITVNVQAPADPTRYALAINRAVNHAQHHRDTATTPADYSIWHQRLQTTLQHRAIFYHHHAHLPQPAPATP